MVRVTVCELPDYGAVDFAERVDALADHADATDADLVVVPELAFGPWLPAREPEGELDAAWREAADTHAEWLDHLDVDATVVGSRPVVRETRRNEAFVREPDGDTRGVHLKSYLPEEPGFREASWYEPGDGGVEPVEAAGLSTGPLVCTDLWASHEVRRYGRQGVELLVNPRVTERRTTEKWLAGTRTMGVLAGAYVASSNRSRSADGVVFGGAGWVTSPDGTVLARTDDDTPFATVAVDPAVAETAKSTYPRDALDRAADGESVADGPTDI